MKNNSKTVYGGDLCVELTEVDKMLDESERIEQNSNTMYAIFYNLLLLM